MRVLSIDPGASGGLAAIDFGKGTFEWRPMPMLELRLGKGKRRKLIDTDLVEQFMVWFRPDVIVLEMQAPMPAQSAPSTFTLGANFGKLRGLALLYRSRHGHVRVINAQPTTWKGELGVPADKLEATRLCEDIFGVGAPLKDGPAEALLIGYWYWKRRQIHGDRADAGILVEPRTLATRTAFLASHDPGRSGTFDGQYTPPAGRAPGRLFAPRDRSDGKKARPGRTGSRTAGRLAGLPDPTLQAPRG